MVKAGRGRSALCVDQFHAVDVRRTFVIAGWRPPGNAVIQSLAARSDRLLLHPQGNLLRREPLEKRTQFRIETAVVEHGLAHDKGCLAQQAFIIKCHTCDQEFPGPYHAT